MHIDLCIRARDTREVRFERVTIRTQIAQDRKTLMPDFHRLTILEILFLTYPYRTEPGVLFLTYDRHTRMAQTTFKSFEGTFKYRSDARLGDQRRKR